MSFKSSSPVQVSRPSSPPSDHSSALLLTDPVEWCTHASVVEGRLTSFVACPSNDMLMTYENGTCEEIGRRAEQWTRDLLEKLANDDTPSGKKRRLTGHFSFDFIISTRNDVMYPIECNARVHTAVIMLPLSQIAACYTSKNDQTLRPDPCTLPRSWLYNDMVMRYLPRLIPLPHLLGMVHPSLPACVVPKRHRDSTRPDDSLLKLRVDPSLVADDWVPFLVLWHVYWPSLLLIRWWQGKYWTRVSTLSFDGSHQLLGRTDEALSSTSVRGGSSRRRVVNRVTVETVRVQPQARGQHPQLLRPCMQLPRSGRRLSDLLRAIRRVQAYVLVLIQCVQLAHLRF